MSYLSFLVLCSCVLVGIISAAPDCAKPPSEVNALKMRQCCNGPRLEGIMKESFTEACKAFLPSQETDASGNKKKSKGAPGGSKCAFDCMVNQTNIFENGVFNKANADKFINEIIKDDDFTPILQKAMEKCAKDSKEKLQSMPNDDKTECSSLPGIFLRCLSEEAVLNCPESRWLQSTNCNNVRKFITACGIPDFKKGSNSGKPDVKNTTPTTADVKVKE